MSQATGNLNLIFNLLGIDKITQASNQTQIFSTGINTLKSKLNEISSSLTKTEQGFSSLTNTLKALSAITVGGLGFQRLATSFEFLKKTFEETQTAGFLLKQALENVSAGGEFDRVKKFAEEFTENIAITLPEAYFALSRIIEISGRSQEDFLKKSLTAVKNLAVFYGGDLNRAIINFTRVFTSSLEQLGQDFPQLRELREVLGDSLFRAGAGADFLNQKLGGLAEEFAKSNRGLQLLADNRLQRRVLNLGEIVSNAITPADRKSTRLNSSH